MTDNVPPELRRLEVQTGASWDGITETQVTFEIATRIAALLRSHGYVVDILPTTVPAGYLADAFVALHMDGDRTGENSGYKLAHGSRRGPFELLLLEDVKAEYGAATGLPYDFERISRAMLGYYAFSWQRYRSATSPFTPSVILEMGFLSNDGDRALAMDRPGRGCRRHRERHRTISRGGSVNAALRQRSSIATDASRIPDALGLGITDALASSPTAPPLPR